MTLGRSLEDRRVWLEVWEGLAADDEDVVERRAQAMGQRAGQVAGVFLPFFVPLDEDQSGDTLVVDCRPGLHQGCVTHWMKYDADHHGPVWWSIGQMLAEVADHLEGQTPCRYWRPQVLDGLLSWDLDEALGFGSRCLAYVPANRADELFVCDGLAAAARHCRDQRGGPGSGWSSSLCAC